MASRVLIGLVVMFSFPAIGCGATDPASDGPRGAKTTGSSSPTQRAVIMVRAMSPLVVQGTGFAPLERVHVTTRTEVRNVRAGRSGRFVVRFPETNTCSGVTLVAKGSRGSRATVSINSSVQNVHCL